MQKFIEIAKANPNLNNDELFTKLMQDEYAQHNPSQQYAPYSGILQAQPGSPQQPEPATVLNPFAPAKKPLNPPTQLVNPYEVKSAKEIPPFQSQQPTPVLEQDLLNTEKAVQVLQLLKASQQGGFDLSKLSEKDINFLANMGANIPGQTFDEPGAKIPAYASYPNPPQLSPLDSPNDSNQQQYSPVAPLSVPDYASGPKYTYTNTQSTPAAQCGVPKNIRPGDLSFIFNNGRGNGRQGRIAGGQLAVTGEVCWQAAIMYDGQYFSGGTILSDKHIITAAHEVHGKDWSRISVKLGLTDLRSRIDPRCDLKSEYFIANVIVSPNFNPRTLSSDIVVLELAEKINLNSHCVCTACLKPQMPKEGDRCVVSGYGSSRLVDPSGTPNERSAAGLAGENTEVLSYVALPIVSNTVCSSGLRNERIAPVIPPPFGILDSTQLCAGGVGSRDACYGDGGSPLVCFHADSFYLAGVVSYGRGCGKQLLPGVYASVPAQLQWLENVIAS